MRYSFSTRAWLALAVLALSLPVGFAGLGQLLTPTPIVIDDGASAPAFQTTGTWVSLPIGNAERSSLRYSSKGTATWTASVAPGTYAVDVSVPPLLRVVQQTYSVTDGSSVIGTFIVPRYVPGDKKAQSNWISGVTVSTANGTIAVTLSVSAGIGVADAVRITPVAGTSSSSSSSSSAPVCGNNEVEGQEQCDFGAMNGQPCMAPAGVSCTYCSASCTRVVVDGVRPWSGSSSSPAPACGNGIVEGQEQCDDGVANGTMCESVIGGSCSYCSASCTRVMVGGRSSSSSSVSSSVSSSSSSSSSSSFVSSSSSSIAGTCSDGIDNDADGGADVASLTQAAPTGSKHRSTFVSRDAFKGVSYIMYQDESNAAQTIEARDASNSLVASKTFDTTTVRRDVFGSPAIDSWTRMFTKPYYSDFTTANADAVFGLVADSTVATVAVGTAGTPASRTVKESKVVRYSSDLSKIEAVLSTGTDRFPHGRMFATPDGTSLVLFAVGTVKRMEVPNAANEYSSPFILVIDAATFAVKARYAVDTPDMAIPYPLYVGNDKVVFALNRIKQPFYSVGIFANAERLPVQIVEFIPSTGAARTVDQGYNIVVGVPGDPRALSDGSFAYLTVAQETKQPNGQKTQVPYLAKIDVSTLLTAGAVRLPSDYGFGTRIIKLLPNGYLATLRTRLVAQSNTLDEEVVLYKASGISGIVAEQAATVAEGIMMRSPDALFVRTNNAVPRSQHMSFDQTTGTFYDFDGVNFSMLVRTLRSDAQCVSAATPE